MIYEIYITFYNIVRTYLKHPNSLNTCTVMDFRSLNVFNYQYKFT